MRLPQIVWLPQGIAAAILAEADRWFDLETGGSLMGYRANEREIVVTAHIDAGPRATREKYRFEPDQAWQQERIDEHYAASGRLDVYLGDWHTHPRAISAQLSYTDRACVRRIISTREARQSCPIMMLLIGEAGSWEMCPKVCIIQRLWGVLPWLEENAAKIRLY
ncbi:Mov34/MPN/PAD-1 family protein [Aurantimonas marianensis]|uniref:Mov34/MPN/PAD-1 family protein n=1 Tax=Aurantimonas marianensis TaxID=2920428 RepID=UPI003C2E9C91